MTERLHFHALEKEMATHSSVLAWRIPGMGEPGGLPSKAIFSAGRREAQAPALCASVAELPVTKAGGGMERSAERKPGAGYRRGGDRDRAESVCSPHLSSSLFLLGP